MSRIKLNQQTVLNQATGASQSLKLSGVRPISDNTLYRHRHSQLGALSTAKDHATQRSNIGVVSTPCGYDVLLAGGLVVGGIEFAPAFAGTIDAEPGVSGICAGELFFVRRRQGFK